MADVFGAKQLDLNFAPVTADECLIQFDGKLVASATNFALTYGRSVTRRRSIGNQQAVMIPTQPGGSVSIQRLLTTDMKTLLEGPSWKVCKNGGTITVALGAACDGGKVVTYHCTGCVVTNYAVQGEAEGLTVVDSLTIEFMQLTIS